MKSPDSGSVGPNSQLARSTASGFTLLEMLLVLAILVAITTVTIPVVGRMYDTHRIQQAAMEVRTTLSAARLRAIDHGVAFECRFEPHGRHMVMGPRRARGIQFGSAEDHAAETPERPREGMHVELPQPLYFWTADDHREQLEDQALHELIDGDLLGDRSWSAPVVFATNGTSSNATFEIRDHEGRVVQLVVRGLTGAASTARIVKRSDR